VQDYKILKSFEKGYEDKEKVVSKYTDLAQCFVGDVFNKSQEMAAFLEEIIPPSEVEAPVPARASAPTQPAARPTAPASRPSAPAQPRASDPTQVAPRDSGPSHMPKRDIAPPSLPELAPDTQQVIDSVFYSPQTKSTNSAHADDDTLEAAKGSWLENIGYTVLGLAALGGLVFLYRRVQAQ